MKIYLLKKDNYHIQYVSPSFIDVIQEAEDIGGSDGILTIEEWKEDFLLRRFWFDMQEETWKVQEDFVAKFAEDVKRAQEHARHLESKLERLTEEDE